MNAYSPRVRPWWMSALAVFCALCVALLVPRDLFYPETRDVEVWFGFELRGAAARLTAPLHWAIFAAGAWGFWRCRPWSVPSAVFYLFYVAFSHLVWSEASPHGRGWPSGLAQAAVISLPGLALLRFGRSAAIPVFGTRAPGVFLPGGGQQTGESPGQAALRELAEECGLQAELRGKLGVADELVHSESEATGSSKRSSFFRGRLVASAGSPEPDHELLWLTPDAAQAQLAHASHRWAVAEARRTAPRGS